MRSVAIMGAFSSLSLASPAVLAVEALAAAVVLFVARFRVRGSTLVGPWRWCALACATLACGKAAVWGSPEWAASAWSGPLEFVAAAATLCPTMALLGAKRPQQGGWQFVVLTLWGVLSLPAIETALYRPGQPVTLPPIWAALACVIVGIGTINYLPTRYGLAALLAGGGQLALLAPHIEWLAGLNHTLSAGAATLLASGALVTAALLAITRPADDRDTDSVWRGFCDAYGLVWGLRVAERFNVGARDGEWPVRLGWRRVIPAPASDDGENSTGPLAWRALTMLLRRFVSADWLPNRVDAWSVD